MKTVEEWKCPCGRENNDIPACTELVCSLMYLRRDRKSNFSYIKKHGRERVNTMCSKCRLKNGKNNPKNHEGLSHAGSLPTSCNSQLAFKMHVQNACFPPSFFKVCCSMSNHSTKTHRPCVLTNAKGELFS